MLASKISDHLCNNFVNEALVLKKTKVDEDDSNSELDSSKIFIPKCYLFSGGVFNLKMKFKAVSLEDSLVILDTTKLDQLMENGNNEFPTVINDEAEYLECIGSAFALNSLDGKNDVYFATARHNVAPRYNQETKMFHILESISISHERVYEETEYGSDYVSCSLVIPNHKTKLFLSHNPDITFIKYTFHHLDKNRLPLPLFKGEYFIPRNLHSWEPPINNSTD